MDFDDLLYEPGDLVDLALLGSAQFGPVPLDSLCGPVLELCRPWLTPTCELVLGRTARLVAAGGLATRLGGAADITLAATPAGSADFTLLMRRPLAAPTHDLRFCAENLKLAFLALLDEPVRQEVIADLLAARRRCIACVERQLFACGEDRPLLRACLDRQRRVMAAELDIVGREVAGPFPS
jgi:hypothetical protein